MLSEVIAFALVMTVFEIVLLSMIPPRTRLRLLGNQAARTLVHVAFMVLNLWVHWGTVVGTMSATLSFITSIGAVKLAAWMYGSIKDGRYYTVGLVKYSREDLV